MADENKALSSSNEKNDQNAETIISNAKDIIDFASEAVVESRENSADLKGDNKNGGGDGGNGGNGDDSQLITNSFVGLPLETLIGTPFIAAAKAQQELTATYVETVWDLAYGKKTDKNDKKVNTLDLTIERPIISKDGSKVDIKEFKVSAPILSLVPVPAFTMDEVVVDFDMEVKNSEISNEKNSEGIKSTLGYKSFWGVSASIKGNVTADSEHKRETDTSATYKIHARAVQHPAASGMEKLTDLLTQAMEPIIVEEPKK